MITLITMIALFIVVNTNYSFANKMDKDNYANNFDDMKDQETSDVNQDNYQNNHCKDSAKCENQSLEQLNNQNNHCKDSANCINESVSNIFVCEEKSLCLIQYEGPFELLNPY
ncbi:MAG: hypothetical protein R2685_18220 [Candidatus Nitrosocosmicus sp.]|nr:hypothetical protein [Candidatus Nitrosocosmicus sp.]